MRLKYLFFTIILAASAISGVERVMGQRLMAEAVRYSGDTFTIAVRTPKGAAVYSTNRPTPAELAAIDRGLTDLFAVARKNGYYNKLNYGDYTVFIAHADRTRNGEGQYSPDVAIGAAQYAGTVYDK